MTHHPLARHRCGVTCAFACASASVARDRPLAPKQSADVGTTGGPVTTGLTCRSAASQAPLLRFGPLQHTSAASRCPGQGYRRFIGGSPSRPPDDPASAFGVRRARAVVANLGRRALALAVFRCWRDPRQWHRSMGGRVGDSRLGAGPIVFDPPRKCGRRNRRCSHARDEPDQSSLAADDLAARAGSCTDASFSAVFRYPRAQAVSRPSRTSGSSLARQAHAWPRFSFGGAPGVRPFAGLIPLTGGHAAPRGRGG